MAQSSPSWGTVQKHYAMPTEAPRSSDAAMLNDNPKDKLVLPETRKECQKMTASVSETTVAVSCSTASLDLLTVCI